MSAFFTYRKQRRPQVTIKCSRCGGTGYWEWFTGPDRLECECEDCGGSGVNPEWPHPIDCGYTVTGRICNCDCLDREPTPAQLDEWKLGDRRKAR